MFDSYKYEDNLINELDVEYVKNCFIQKHNIKDDDYETLEKQIKIVLKTPDMFYNNICEFNIDKLLFIKFAITYTTNIFNKRLTDFIRKNYF